MYQFIHIETYARKASTKVKPTNNKYAKTSKAAPAELSSSQRTTHNTPDSNGAGHDAVKKPRANVSQVLGEVMRDIGYCPHVDNPQEPTFLYGDVDTLRSMPARIELNLEAYEKRHNLKRSIRSDTHVLLAGTATFPRELEQSDPDRYIEWRQKTLDYLKKKYGDNLQCVVEHQDESHPHLHFYVISAEHVDAKKLHEGYIAASAFKSMTNEANDAYKDAMRDYQTDYFNQVGHSCGLLRDGPKRKRMPKAEYKAAQRSASETYELNRKAATTIEQATAKERKLNEAMASLVEEKKENGLLLQKATELNADTGRREKLLAKEKEDIAQRDREAFKQSVEARRLLKEANDKLADAKESATKLQAILKRSQEVEDFLKNGYHVTLMQKMKDDQLVKEVIFKVASLSSTDEGQKNQLYLVTSMVDGEENANLKPVDYTQDTQSSIELADEVTRQKSFTIGDS
jgi:hypothetical protein